MVTFTLKVEVEADFIEDEAIEDCHQRIKEALDGWGYTDAKVTTDAEDK